MALGEPEVDQAVAVRSLQYNLGTGYGLELLKDAQQQAAALSHLGE